ncbi:DUF2306 domain-containing protein [Sphingomonas sp. So64.6b]|uniref:DUF2306 domain-containing protein n=1 Tax=Sphingomonas sp. So64.6b TaxID=2997354 RepID=UPI001601D56A|nr:DUF2306 domain-containing protein [Sphingomonas sp. So64.6b]QNA82872.1 DUF2306 domain-containing protein [Sphingomonas sp. So64.6b]
MTETVAAGSPVWRSTATKALDASAVLWYVTAVIGQWLFVAYIAAFYGAAATVGNFEKWNDVLVGGYVAGGTIGNVALAAHLLLAIIITVGGPLQLVPYLRTHALSFHRWNGRLYMLTAIVMSLTGLYMVWTRGTAGGFSMRFGISINAVLILVCAAMAWRYAIARKIAAHRRWALRSFILVSGVWFFRVGLMLWIIANSGPVGIGGKGFDGPFVRFWAYGCYLVPLAVLELYLRAQDRGGPSSKFMMAGLLFVLTAGVGIGIFGAFMGMWLPRMAGG